MRKVKPVRRLFFQFSHLLPSLKLDAYEIFEALSDSGLIEGVSFEGRLPTRYREAWREKLPRREFEGLIRETLTRYWRDEIGTAERSDRDLLEDEQKGRDSEVINSINRGDL